MTFDATIHLGDVIVTLIGVVLIPIGRMLVKTMWDMRESLQRLHFVVMGMEQDPTTGIIGDLAALKKETLRHRNWLIEIRAEQGLKLDDRS